MSLRDFVAPTRTITIRGEHKFSVRALGFDDIQFLLINRHSLIQDALKLFGETGFDAETASEEELRAFGIKLVTLLPQFVAELVALAADEPDQAEKVRRLAAPVQVEALLAIYELTFPEPESVKNFFDHLARLMQKIPRPATVVPTMNPAGLNSSGVTLDS